MEVLSEAMRATFVRRVVARLQADSAHEVEKLGLNEEVLPQVVECSIDKAASYGVLDEHDVELFIDCVMVLGLEFDQDPSFPWAGDILRRDNCTGTEKMSFIHDYLLFST